MWWITNRRPEVMIYRYSSHQQRHDTVTTKSLPSHSHRNKRSIERALRKITFHEMMQFKCICIRVHTETHVPSEHRKLCNDVEMEIERERKKEKRTAAAAESKKKSDLLQKINNAKITNAEAFKYCNIIGGTACGCMKRAHQLWLSLILDRYGGMMQCARSLWPDERNAN